MANLALGFDIPGPGVRIATDGPIRNRQVSMLTTLFSNDPHSPGSLIFSEPLRGLMELTDAERNTWLDYSIELFGLDFPGPSLPPHPGPRWTINWRPEDNRPPSTVVIYRQWVRYKNAPLRAEQLWLAEGLEQSLVRVLDPDAPHSSAVIERAFRGLALMRGNSLLPAIERATKPGPKPGTVARYKSQEAWHQAIRDNVLTRQTRLTAEDTTVAIWLKISARQVYYLMNDWGPGGMPKLRRGDFGNCICNSCKAN